MNHHVDTTLNEMM